MFKNLFIALLCFGLSLPLQAKTFKIATLAPDGTTWMEELKKGADEIKARTQGRVKFRFYPGGIMGNDKSVLRKIRIGQLHGGAITGGGLSDIYPDAQVYSLPLAFNSTDEVDYVRQRMDKKLIANLKDEGYVSFGFSEGGFAYVMSDTPIATVADMKGHKVWSPEGDEMSRAAFESVGVSPIPLPLTDVLTGLQTGLIDTIGSSTMGAVALQWYTRIQNMTQTPLMYLYGTMVIRNKTFNSISAEDQAIVTEVMNDVFKRLDKLNREDNEKAKEALKNQGIHFVYPTEAEQQEWRDTVQKAVASLIKKGVVSQAMADELYGHLRDYRKSQAALAKSH
ncbi:MAG TPA: C4-dicarboxylate ABC transporter [Candidatus Tenderia sp.]|nr:C4-dicarboxylate ABC transporter [Candidatus Tenderia sp.]